jgi:hypothetical protein
VILSFFTLFFQFCTLTKPGLLKYIKYKTVCAELSFASHFRQNGHDFFYRTCNVFFICYAVRLLQYSKSVWGNVGTLTVYMLIICILMPENCFRSGKSCKMYAIIHKVFKFWGILSTLLIYNFYSFKTNFFFLFINLQVEHTLGKCYIEP